MLSSHGPCRVAWVSRGGATGTKPAQASWVARFVSLRSLNDRELRSLDDWSRSRGAAEPRVTG